MQAAAIVKRRRVQRCLKKGDEENVGNTRWSTKVFVQPKSTPTSPSESPFELQSRTHIGTRIRIHHTHPTTTIEPATTIETQKNQSNKLTLFYAENSSKTSESQKKRLKT